MDIYNKKLQIRLINIKKRWNSVDRVIVGVNKFTQETEGITDVLNIDESIRIIQTEK